MLEFFQFALSGFWTFCGTVILLWMIAIVAGTVMGGIGAALLAVIRARSGKP